MKLAVVATLALLLSGCGQRPIISGKIESADVSSRPWGSASTWTVYKGGYIEIYETVVVITDAEGQKRVEPLSHVGNIRMKK